VSGGVNLYSLTSESGVAHFPYNINATFEVIWETSQFGALEANT